MRITGAAESLNGATALPLCGVFALDDGLPLLGDLPCWGFSLTFVASCVCCLVACLLVCSGRKGAAYDEDDVDDLSPRAGIRYSSGSGGAPPPDDLELQDSHNVLSNINNLKLHSKSQSQ